MPERNGFGQFCPVSMAAEVFCSRWTPLILRELLAGTSRFNDLRRGVPRMSPALLSKRLKELEKAGIVSVSRGKGGAVEYGLTPAGEDLKGVVVGLGMWGSRWVESQLSLRNLDPTLLMWDMRRRLVPEPLPPRKMHDSVSVPRIAAGEAELLAGGGRRGGRPLLFRSRLRGRPAGALAAQDDDGGLDGRGQAAAGDRGGQSSLTATRRSPAPSSNGWASARLRGRRPGGLGYPIQVRPACKWRCASGAHVPESTLRSGLRRQKPRGSGRMKATVGIGRFSNPISPRPDLIEQPWASLKSGLDALEDDVGEGRDLGCR